MKKNKLLALSLCIVGSITVLSGCNAFKTLDHTHNYIVQTIQPTQTNDGYDLHACTCGDSYMDNYTCLITFSNLSTSTSLPQVEPEIVSKNATLEAVSGSNGYIVKEYRDYKTNDFYTNHYPGYTISNSCTINLVWDTSSAPTTTHLNFNELINKIEQLEQISKQYNIDKQLTKDPNLRVAQYIRQTRYSGSTWNAVGGTLESDFAQYVANNQVGYDLSTLQTLDTFINVNSNKEVDFVHMMATINSILKNGITNNQYNDLAGWSGDLCQLAVELKETGLTGDELNSTAISLFSSTSSSFSSYDVNADFDAINIASIYNNLATNKSISYAMKQYYNAFDTSKQKKEVLLNTFPTIINNQTGEKLKTQSEFVSDIATRLSNNLLIKVWCSTNNLNLTNDIQAFNASINAFANYLFN